MLQSIYTHAGCDYGCLYTYSPRHCFNPHTHAGCDNVHNVSGASFPVSIHTPTQGVTFLYICNVFRICFNPHTHAGCDNPLPRLTRVHNRFNPHTHAGCDSAARPKVLTVARFQSTHPRRVWPSCQSYSAAHTFVSIHTPTQGVTSINNFAKSAWSFNPHTHAGCDSVRTTSWNGIPCFNPHTHAGCDCFYNSCFCDDMVSIHTPTQGVTLVLPI